MTDEEAWWAGLEGADLDVNLHGVPPYDVEPVVERVLGAIDSSTPRILDVGCGRGRLTNRVAELIPGAQVFGVDVSRTALDLAALAAPPNAYYLHCDGRNLPPILDGWKFDLVYSVTVFQHVPYDAVWGYIEQVHRLLADGGIFTFSYAQGSLQHFANHQLSDRKLVEFSNNLRELFGHVWFGPECDENGWSWVTTWTDEQ